MTSDSAVHPHTPTGLDAAAWHLAASLAERVERTALGRPPSGVDAERGRRRLEAWKEEKFYTFTPEQLAKWLASHGLTESGLVALLGETRESVAARFAHTPEHVRTIERAWSAGHPADHPGGHGFLTLVAPLIDDGRRRIRSALAQLLADRPTEHVTYETLAEQLCAPPAVLPGVLSRTIVLELNVLRVRGGLEGATPEDRFQHFLRKLADPEYAVGLLRDYPVLARDLVRVVDNWVRTRVEFAGHLLADLPGLLVHLGDPGTLGTVAEVSFNAGDSHRGGRSVAIVRFTDGRKVVYKPRSLAVDVHFQELLRGLNGLGVRPELRTLWVLDRADHGWTEFVSTGGCADREAVVRFYRRQGAHLALLYCLAATDFHYENLIASGEHPVLVDLEALFHPMTSEREMPPHMPPHAVRVLSDSVLSVGLLPTPVISFEDDAADGLDLSGLGTPAGQLTAAPVPTWQDQGTDRMHLVRRRVEMRGGQNLPSLTQDTVTVLDFQDELVAGFQRTYRLLLAHRDTLLAPGGPVDAFAADSVRVVLRSTQTYARILQEGHHPDLLRDGLDRDRFFSLLWGEQHSPVRDAAVSTAELDQLSAGDIPIFTARADSLDLVSGDGTVIPAALEQSGMDRARRRIRSLSEEDLARQTWFLDASLTALTLGDDVSEPPAALPAHGPAPASAPATDDALIAAARRTGDRLLELAVTDGDTISWLGLALVGEKVWHVGPASMDLYNGIAGISLFLAHLAEQTGEPAYRRAAEAGSRALVGQLERLGGMDEKTVRLLGMGVCAELGGSVYALSHLGALWNRPDLLDGAALAVAPLRTLTPDDRALDVVAGSAGAVLAGLALYSVRPDDGTLDAVTSMADHLAARADTSGTGAAWHCSINPAAPLTGFSHGASGIAVALARVDAVTGRGAYTDLVRAALRFERASYDPAAGHWPDLRDTVPAGASMTAWCHGAPGIGAARAALLPHLPDDGPLREDLATAVRATLDAGYRAERLTGRGNHSLCHGDTGNIEALQLAARATGDAGLTAHVGRLAAALLSDIERRGPLCGVPRGVETPGLMTGLAGIGHGLLRLARPDAVPSVLLFEGPKLP
ncbi:type 2 lanthipeptide synthetase LanM family protein [Streptomyces sp. NPDC050703]|uniref:type 2 lanthipeptide synthetase LanM family protein n=1 Tax=Streptomyces sp. NPDC050703 TaxID=3157218 RepID=UPI00342F436D